MNNNLMTGFLFGFMPALAFFVYAYGNYRRSTNKSVSKFLVRFESFLYFVVAIEFAVLVASITFG